jgi:gliding motility-associated-like protein
MTATCDGGIAVVSGTAGGTFLFNTPPGDGAVIDPVTGEITSGTSGTQYDVLYTTNGVCWLTSTQLVTVTSQDDPAFVLTPTCDGATAIVSGLSGGTFTFTNAPGDGAIIDLTTGLISGGTPGTIYGVMYTTTGACPSNLVQQVTAYSLPFAPNAGTDITYCSSDFFDDMTANGGAGIFKWYDEAGSLIGVGSLMQPYDLVGVNSYYVSETMNGCEGPLSIVVITVEECDILIPTAFTPAGYPNSVWEILNLDNVYPNNVVQIYNRWGSLIYESEPGKYDLNPWDGSYKGELQPVSSYYYIIEFNDKNNESAKGTVTLILNN